MSYKFVKKRKKWNWVSSDKLPGSATKPEPPFYKDELESLGFTTHEDMCCGISFKKGALAFNACCNYVGTYIGKEYLYMEGLTREELLELFKEY